MPVRKPHVAGSFYPSDPAKIKKFCEILLKPDRAVPTVKALILPHAGYVYSGATACKVLAQADVPESVLMIGPDHYASGGAFSVYPSGEWQTPLGSVPIDRELAIHVTANSKCFKEMPQAHAAEHSLEVILPMLQLCRPEVRVLPVQVATLDPALLRDAAEELAAKLPALAKPPLVVISTDMSHYDDDQTAREKDRYALEAIRRLDAGGLFDAARRYRITMCGLGPVLMLLHMAPALGITKAELVDYRTSGEVSGDLDRVVGYAGFILN